MRRILLPVLALALPWGAADAQCTDTNLLPPDPQAGDRYGVSVAVDGGLAVVGASDVNLSSTGKAYVYRLTGGAWTVEDVLTPVDGFAGDRFGTSVSVEGDTVVVGAPSHGPKGAAYVFERSTDPGGGPPTWNIAANLTALGASSGSQFGHSVSVHGDALAVGAYADDSLADQAGAVFLYRRGPLGWMLHEEIVPFDVDAGDRFGFSVDLYGEYLIAGCTYDSDLAFHGGSVYAFRFDGSDWEQDGKLIFSAGTAGGQLGHDVEFDRTSSPDEAPLAVVSAVGQVGPGGILGGRAYVWQRSPAAGPVPSHWKVLSNLSASNAADGDRFGSSVSVHEGRVLVGAPLSSPSLAAAGTVYLYEPSGGLWWEVEKITSGDPSQNAQFGGAVAISGAWLLAGAPLHDPVLPGQSAPSLDAGSLHARPIDLGLCPELCDGPRIPHPEVEYLDQFGYSVSVSEGRALISALQEDGAAAETGAVYVYRKVGTCWTREARLEPAGLDAYARFGSRVLLHGDLAFVGATSQDVHALGDGAVYVYRRKGTTWTLVDQLSSQEPKYNNQFGSALAFDGTYLAVGAPHNTVEPGEVDVFHIDASGQGSPVAHLTPGDGAQGDKFGIGLAFQGDLLAVGAYHHTTPVGEATGAVYVYRKLDGLEAWALEAQLASPETLPYAGLGDSVAFAGDDLFASAPFEDPGGVFNGGAVYRFRREEIGSGVSWIYGERLAQPAPVSSDYFGFSIEAEDGVLAVGMPGVVAEQTGTVFLYEQLDGAWAPTGSYRPIGWAPGSQFGYSVSLDGTDLLVGARDDPKFVWHGGATWAFDVSVPLQPLEADLHAMSVTTGGYLDLLLNAGEEHVGKLYFVLGSLSGTSPGIDFGGGVVLPLNHDAYYDLTLQNANTPFFPGTLSTLEAPGGWGDAAIYGPPGMNPSFVGTHFHYAYLVLGPGTVDMASNAVQLTLVP